MAKNSYDLIIIGGGPAGAAAGVYAARKRIPTLLITEEWGGQSNVSPDIQNWIGTVSISGTELGEAFKKHVEAYAGEVLEVKDGVRVTDIAQNDDSSNNSEQAKTFTVTTNKDEEYSARAVLMAAGADRRKLDVPGAAEFENKGVVYCASCDGPLFADQDVAVIGGGNAGFETAAQLLAYTKSVTLLQRSDSYKADKITVDKVLAHDNMTGILNANTTEVLGDKLVTGLKYKDEEDNEHTLDVTGVFVEIGLIPATDFVADLLELDEYKRIIIDPWNQRTSVEGVWAAGDATNVLYHQNNIAAGDAVTALEDIYQWLKKTE